MTPDRTPEDEIARSGAAERLLKDPLFVEACNALDSELRMLRERVPLRDTEMHSRLILAEQMHAKVLDYLRGVMESGHAARLMLANREGLMQRMKQAMEHGIRNVF
jgi:hypothetical protein